jgi:hypothetical protein
MRLVNPIPNFLIFLIQELFSKSINLCGLGFSFVMPFTQFRFSYGTLFSLQIRDDDDANISNLFEEASDFIGNVM